MNKEDVKVYLKKHGKEIACGTICVLTGIYIGKRKYGLSNEEFKLIKTLRGANAYKENNTTRTPVQILNGLLSNSRTVYTYYGEEGKQIIGPFDELWKRAGMNKQTTGVLVFTK